MRLYPAAATIVLALTAGPALAADRVTIYLVKPALGEPVTFSCQLGFSIDRDRPPAMAYRRSAERSR